MSDPETSGNNTIIFEKIIQLEQQYKEQIKQTRIIWEQKLHDTQATSEEIYKLQIDQRRKQLEYELHSLANEVEKKLHALEAKENLLLSQIDLMLSNQKRIFLQKIWKIMEFSF